MAARLSIYSGDKRIVLVGRTGAGKSSTGNTLLGKKVFTESSSASSVTRNVAAHTKVIFSEEIRVVDTPGLFDTEISNSETLLELTKCLLLSTPGPHVVAFVMPVGRFTEEERQSFQIILKTFGEEVIRHMMIIFTGGDSLSRHNKTIDEFVKGCPEYLKELLSKCGNRYVAINNLASDGEKAKYQKQIIQVVNSTIAGSEREFYSNELYVAVTEKLQERVQAQLEKETSEAELGYVDIVMQMVIENQDEIWYYAKIIANLLVSVVVNQFFE